MLKLESGEGVALVSLDTGALVVCADAAPGVPGDSTWRVLDRSPISARIVAGAGADRVELRYELDGRRLSCERRTADGRREIRFVEVSADTANAKG